MFFFLPVQKLSSAAESAYLVRINTKHAQVRTIRRKSTREENAQLFPNKDEGMHRSGEGGGAPMMLCDPGFKLRLQQGAEGYVFIVLIVLP